MKTLVWKLIRVCWLISTAQCALGQGGVPLWTNRFGAPYGGYDQPGALICDSSGNVIVTGYDTSSYDHSQMATIKYSASGVPLWTNIFDQVGMVGGSGNALSVDSQGRIFVAGTTSVTNGDIYWSRFTTLCYSSDGAPMWTNLYAYDIQVNSASAVTIDSNGNVVVTGSSFGGQLQYMYATVAYSSTGAPLWTNYYGGGLSISASYATGVAADTNGNVFVTGYSFGSWERLRLCYAEIFSRRQAALDQPL